MNRRGFLASLIAGAVLDPERLLWVPGAKLISIPAAQSAEMVGITLRWTKSSWCPLTRLYLSKLEVKYSDGEFQVLA